MNWKLLTAFAAGALLASGIVYMAVKDDAPSRVSLAPAPAPAASAPVVKPLPPPPDPIAMETPAIPPTRALPKAAPVREKPSPLPPPVRRQQPIAVARNENPPRPAVAQKQPDPPPVEAQIPSEPQPPPPAPPQITPPAEEPPPQQPEPEARVPNTVTITAGTLLAVRIGETISASRNQVGDEFLATLDRQLVVDGFIIAEKGSRLLGRVVQAEPASRGTGTSRLGIELVKLSTADGQHVYIRTAAYRKDAASSTGSDLAKVGIGTALGAAIGGAAGSGKGAAIGAGAGAAAGGAGAVLTHAKPAEIPLETRITFRIENPVTLTERLN
jgi:hypothetical protein